MGQLGHGDFKQRETPARIKTLEGKKVTAIGLGEDFIVALGLTLPFADLTSMKKHKGHPERSRSNSNNFTIKRLKKAPALSHATDQR